MWSSKAATDLADEVAIETECKVYQEDDRRPAASYPAPMLMEIERGSNLHTPYVSLLEAEDKEDSA
jgi:hypothetical protein